MSIIAVDYGTIQGGGASASGQIPLSSTTVGSNATVTCGFKPSKIAIGVHNSSLGITFLTYENGVEKARYNDGSEHESTSSYITPISNGFTVNRVAAVWDNAYYLAAQ